MNDEKSEAMAIFIQDSLQTSSQITQMVTEWVDSDYGQLEERRPPAVKLFRGTRTTASSSNAKLLSKIVSKKNGNVLPKTKTEAHVLGDELSKGASIKRKRKADVLSRYLDKAKP